MQAKQVTLIPNEEGIIPLTDFQKLLKHAKNSGMWYCQNTAGITSSKIKEKLLAKGYPNRAVKCETEDGIQDINFIDEVIDYLKASYLLDDNAAAKNMLQNLLNKGFGPNRIESDLKQSGVDAEIIEDLLEELDESSNNDVRDALENAAVKIMRKSSFQKAEKWKQKMILSRDLWAKGFTAYDVEQFLVDFETEEDEDW